VKSSASTVSAGEFRDELESDIYNTEKALKRAKIKYQTAVLETSIVSAAAPSP
jgi:hypothetical protein